MTTPKEKQKRNLIPRERRGLRYPVEYVAAELGVDRKTLERRCEAAGFHLNGAGLTFREAHTAWFEKWKDVELTRRQKTADAEKAEFAALTSKQEFFKLASVLVQDASVKTRVIIEGETDIPLALRHKLIKKVAEIKPSAAEASHK